jgi:general stress protein YciG
VKENDMASQNKQSNQNANRGFASMDKEKQRDIARKGGKASHGGGGNQGSNR